MRNNLYKTSMIYGDQIVVIPEDIKAMFTAYIEKIRPYIIEKGQDTEDEGVEQSESNQYIFTTQGKDCQLASSDVSKFLTSSFRKAGNIIFH